MAIIVLTVAAGLLLIHKYDPEAEIRFGHKDGMALVLASFFNSQIINSLMIEKTVQVLLFSILAGMLLLACVTDCKICQVHQFVWWISGMAAVVLILQNTVGQMGKENRIDVMELVFFCLLQQFFFAKMYGRADCHAFCICAMTEYALGISVAGHLLHMLLAFSLLAVVQLFQKNINCRGNLKRPVPFLPYITVSFWFLTYIYT